MRRLFTYSPVLVLVGWATWVTQFGRSDLTGTIGLLALAASLWLHVREERRAKP